MQIKFKKKMREKVVFMQECKQINIAGEKKSSFINHGD
jgi:hypothetical protein